MDPMSPVQFDAMSDRIMRDLAWVQERCEKVAVVAHSQGAAIVHAVLQERLAASPEEPPVDMLITYGSAIKILHTVRMLRDRASRWSWVATVGAIVLPVLSILELRMWIAWGVGRDDSKFLLWPVVLGLNALAGGLLVVLWRHYDKFREPILRSGGLGGPAFPWMDFFATADPVPNGPLVAPVNGGSDHRHYPEPIEVVNRGSIVYDHGSYDRNEDQFLACVATRLGDLGGVTMATDPDAQLSLAEGWPRRRWRQGWVVARRYVFVALGVAAFVRLKLTGGVRRDGGRLLAHTPAFVATALKPFRGVTDALLKRVHVGNGEMTGTLLLAATILALSLAASLPWHSWVAADLGRYYRHQPSRWGGPAFALYLSAVAGGATVLARMLAGIDPFAGWRALGSAASWMGAVAGATLLVSWGLLELTPAGRWLGNRSLSGTRVRGDGVLEGCPPASGPLARRSGPPPGVDPARQIGRSSGDDR